MSRYKYSRRVQIDDSASPTYDDVVDESTVNRNVEGNAKGEEGRNHTRLRLSDGNVRDDQEQLMGTKVRRKASLHRDAKGDYLDVPSHPHLKKSFQKQGDSQLVFANKVLKFTDLGKMKRRILLITDFAVYIVDPETDALTRQVD